MIDFQTFPIFLAGALLLNITPGPDMAFTLATSARGGTRAGIAAALGVGAGAVCWAFLTAAGLAALLAASQHAMMFIRIIGGFYLLYLAIEAFKHRKKPVDAVGALGGVKAFRSGALTNLLNPKVGLFYLAFLPTFANAELGPIWLQTITLGVIFSVSGAMVLILVAFAAGNAREKFLNSELFRVRLNTLSALIFGSLGAYLLFSRAK